MLKGILDKPEAIETKGKKRVRATQTRILPTK